MKLSKRTVVAAAAAGVVSLSSAVFAQTVTDAITGGSASGSFRLRYEGVDEDNALDAAKALTLRSAIQYTTEVYSGFSAAIEVEDVSIVGLDDYSVGPTGYKAGEYSVIADPESTEINQGYVMYAKDGFSAKLGRQAIVLDNQRFVGSVGWRQDHQTFDALTLGYKGEGYSLDYSYLEQRNRIFADAADLDSKDHLLHAGVTTPIGLLTGYAYLLEMDIPTGNALDTIGVRLAGSRKVGETSFSYLAEFAAQDMENGAIEADADYFLLEGGVTLGKVTAKLGYESLGSDGGTYGFGTPLATLHAFNGWADVFLGTPAQGLNDLYLNLSAPVAGGSFAFIYHDYEADESGAGVDDLGSEFNLQWTRPFLSKYTFGLKYADYDAGDAASGKVDKQIFWSWVQLNF